VEKLYRKDGTGRTEYWEYWDAGSGKFTIHWGELGTEGNSKSVGARLLGSGRKTVLAEMQEQLSQGFAAVDEDDHEVLIVEYAVDGMGCPHDLDKRAEVEDRLNELLGWTGLGACDGGSIGSGSMEIACFVVDYDIAERVIRENLAGTDFGDSSRIYRE
jgi:hypothetical protein